MSRKPKKKKKCTKESLTFGRANYLLRNPQQFSRPPLRKYWCAYHNAWHLTSKLWIRRKS